MQGHLPPAVLLKLDTATAGSASQPVYFKDGKPVAATHKIESDVPADAKFSDTVYTHPSLGVTAGTFKSVTVNAQGHVTAGSNPTTLAGYGITDAVKNDDSRLTDSRPASDVSAWAKAESKPTYTKAEVGLGNVDNTADASKNVAMATKLQTYKEGSTSETYGTQYPLFAQWDNTGKILKLVCTGYTVKADSASVADSANAVAWSNVSSKPASYTPSEHNHDDLYAKKEDVNFFETTSVTNPAGKVYTYHYGLSNLNDNDGYYIGYSYTPNSTIRIADGKLYISAREVRSLYGYKIYEEYQNSGDDTWYNRLYFNIGKGPITKSDGNNIYGPSMIIKYYNFDSSTSGPGSSLDEIYVNFPEKSGTLATTDDLPDFNVPRKTPLNLSTVGITTKMYRIILEQINARM